MNADMLLCGERLAFGIAARPNGMGLWVISLPEPDCKKREAALQRPHRNGEVGRMEEKLQRALQTISLPTTD